MTTNEVLHKQNFLSKVLLKDGDVELSRSLKVKIMAMRIEYAKIRKQFEADLQEFVKDLSTDEFRQLQQIPEEDRTEEQQTRYQELLNKINGDYNEYVQTRSMEEVEVKNKSLTEDEYFELVNVNASNDVEINGTKLSSADFLEILYSLFVE